MKKSKLIGERPPLTMEYRVKLQEIADALTADSGILEFTGHNALLMCIDRAHEKLFPDRHVSGSRKKFIKVEW